MDIVECYRAYAEAFEATFEDDDWSRLEPYFSEDASYSPGRDTAYGRDGAFALLKKGIDDFDRKMDTRVVEFLNVATRGNEVHVDWKASYTRAGLPDLAFSGREIARFENDRIAELRNEWEPEVVDALRAWMAAHADKL